MTSITSNSTLVALKEREAKRKLTSSQIGLQAEEPKHPAPGAGLCPGYTTSRAILADAIALTRGDRFMTTDFTRTLGICIASAPRC